MEMTVLPICAFRDNYIWTLVKQNKAVCIDPGDAKPVLTELAQRKLILEAILITHHHWDHTNGIHNLLEYHPTAVVYGPNNAKITHISNPVGEHDQIELPHFDLTLQIFSTPGHTHDHIVYYGNHSLFCGDTLFSAGCGRLFEGSCQEMYSSLQKLSRLPDDTLIYCAHEYTEANLRFAKLVEPGNADIAKRLTAVHELRRTREPSLPSTLAQERLTNPFLRVHLPSVKYAAEKFSNCPLETPLAVFAAIRDWKNRI